MFMTSMKCQQRKLVIENVLIENVDEIKTGLISIFHTPYERKFVKLLVFWNTYAFDHPNLAKTIVSRNIIVIRC